MDYLPFNTVGLTLNGVDIFYKTYDALKNRFKLQLTGDIDFHLEQFEVFKPYKDINIRGSLVIKQCDSDCYIFFIEANCKHTALNGHIQGHKEYQLWALAYLKHDFGRAVIRRETLTDKIMELVHPVELDFSADKAFSDTFYVLVDDHEKAVAGINREFRNAVMDVRCDDFIIEISEHTLLIGSTKQVAPEKALHLAAFIERVAEMC